MKAANRSRLVRVLVVDDSADDTDLAVWELRRGGFQVTHLRVDDSATLEMALKQGHWDVALVDENMPGFAGSEARKLLEKQQPELPFIIFSGYLSEAMAANAIRAGASDLVLKNNLPRLVPAIERVFQENELRRQKEETAKALADSHTRYDQLFSLSPDAILVLEKHRVRMLNTTAVKLLGASSPEQVIGKRIASLFKCTEALNLERRLRALTEHDQSLPLMELKLVNLQGQTIDAEIAFAACAAGKTRRIQMVVRDVSDRRRLEREVLEISHRERQRIGQDLHDSLCQLLLGVKYRGTILQEIARQNFPAATAECQQIVELLDRAIAEAQALAKGLAPVSLEEDGLRCALRELAELTRRVFGVECQCRFAGRIGMREYTLAMHLYRIAQEAVSNAVKHGKPKKIEISLQQTGEFMVLSVVDDGRGFARAKLKTKGMGWRTMEYRARVMRGTLRVLTKKNHGTEVRCVIPCWNRRSHNGRLSDPGNSPLGGADDIAWSNSDTE